MPPVDSYSIFASLCKEHNLKLSAKADAYLKVRIKNERYLTSEDGIRSLFTKTVKNQSRRIKEMNDTNKETASVISIRDLQVKK